MEFVLATVRAFAHENPCLANTFLLMRRYKYVTRDLAESYNYNKLYYLVSN